ncbi:MAG: Hsp20/alpha crystallin family protein [Chloroflexi bacterium]|nr:Hsp20/alpha crystallin family protein [Chloroflexota bacterium]
MTFYITPYRRVIRMKSMPEVQLEKGTNAAESRESLLPVDVVADDEAYTLQAVVPGVQADDIQIEVLKNRVSIRGEFKNQDGQDERCLLRELPGGKFRRSLALPSEIDAEKVEARLENGLLTLRLPKAEAYRPKTIHINVN